LRNRPSLAQQAGWVVGACACWLLLSAVLWVPQLTVLVASASLVQSPNNEALWVAAIAAGVRFVVSLVLTWLAVKLMGAPRSVWIGILAAQLLLVAAFALGQPYFDEEAPWWQYALYHGGAALPGVVRGGEVELDPGGSLDLLVAVELGSVVRGDRCDPSGVALDEPDTASDGVGSAVALELAHHRVAGGALHHRDHGVASVLGAHDRVDLPVTDLDPVLDLGWALGYVALTCDLAA
jgi:hypothetical protein